MEDSPLPPKRSAGRPPEVERKWQGREEELASTIDAWFSQREDEKKPLGYLGLCYAIGCHHEAVNWYVKEGANERLSDTLKRARMRCSTFWEELLGSGKPVGSIFWLKAQGYMQDRQDVNVSLDADSWAGAMASAAALKQERRKGKPKDGPE